MNSAVRSGHDVPRSAVGHPPQAAGTHRAPRGPIPRASLDAPWDRVRLSLASQVVQRRTDTTASRSAVPAPEAGPWAGALARSTVEALLGIRPATQLEHWLTPELYDAVRRRAGLAARVLGKPVLRVPPRVLSTHPQWDPERQIAEVSVVLHDGDRVRAAAVQLEAFRGRWRGTVLEIG